MMMTSKIWTGSTTKSPCLFIDILKGKCQKVSITSELLISMKQKTGAEVSHWPWCEEYHENKDIHYHIPSNITKLQLWKSVKEQLKSKHNINVHFCDKPFGYIANYRYICKSNKEVLQVPNTLHLQMLPSTFLTTDSGQTLVCKL